MSPTAHRLSVIPAAACAAALGLLWDDAGAQTDLAIELKEAEAAVQSYSARLSDMEARLARAKEQVNSLAEALAAANGESQQAREAYERLRVQMEGLGVAALDESSAGLQERLLTALSDLRLLEAQKRNLASALMELSEASLGFARAASEVTGEPKRELDAKLAKAEQVLRALENNQTASDEADLQHARVVSLKEDLGIAVLNVGARHGVHAGMPFSIFRQDKPVARALVVDVRQGICGVIVQELVSKDEPVKVGDTGKVDPERS